MRWIRRISAAAATVILAILCASCAAPLRFAYAPGQVTASNVGGIVAADDGIAAAVGARALRSGGNAIDAAVATAFAMAVTYPQAMNPGGGGFAVVSLPDGRTAALDFRETAPALATRDLFLRPDGSVDRERALYSTLAAGVPGMPAGLAALHRRFGRLSWADLLAPAVRLARDGFPIPQGLADALNEHRERFAA
ncbi:MAG: gamma-glutamyltransferase, partial [Planctomycetes bacterium]|nr:gamma-glutamyltransferase [Planctomycetota bacterium]